jgi:hypothetical protein
LISCEPAAIDSDRAKRLIAATRHHTNDILNRNPVPFDLCLRYGMLQEHAAERFDASLNPGNILPSELNCWRNLSGF